MKKSSIGLAALLAFTGAAIAQNAQGPQNPATNPGSQKTAPPLQFSALDINKDGRVSRDEVKAHAELTTSFGTLDSDKDTYLSETEFGKWHATPSPGAVSPRDPSPGAASPGGANPGGGMNTPGNPGGAQSTPGAQ
jgi:hypothetical protein